MTVLHKNSVLIFDFDGTLADSLDSVVSKVNQVVTTFGHQPLKEETIERYLTSNSRTWLRQFPLTRWLTSLGMNLIAREQSAHISQLEPVPHLFSVLSRLHRNGFRIGIVTSNSEEIVNQYLQYNHRRKLFTFIHGGGGLYGKAALLHQVLIQEQLQPKQVIYIGDEPRDIEAAQAVGVQVIGVTWGFQSKEVLQSLHPDWIIDDPAELLKLTRLNSVFGRIGFWLNHVLRSRRRLHT